jgi:hypothetical protein
MPAPGRAGSICVCRFISVFFEQAAAGERHVAAVRRIDVRSQRARALDLDGVNAMRIDGAAIGERRALGHVLVNRIL